MEKEEIITFQKPWKINVQKEPSCFNDSVNIRKYKITIEIIDEPKEVLGERLEKLWVKSNNYHNWEPLEKTAKEIGYTFKGKFGEKK